MKLLVILVIFALASPFSRAILSVLDIKTLARSLQQA